MIAEPEPSVADLFGVPHELTYTHEDGRVSVYELRQPNLLEQARFSRWLERRALEAASRAVDLPEDVQERLFRSVARDIASCVYEYPSAATAEALATPVGQAKMLHLILSAKYPEVTEEFAAKILDRNHREIAAIWVTGGDPNHPKAQGVLAGLGLEPDFLSTTSRSFATPPSASAGTKSGG